MALPKKLKIGPLNYEVKVVKDLRNPAGQAAYGNHSYDSLRIQIDDQINKDLQDIILLHEVLHALCCTQEIELDYDKEEHVVKNLTHGLARFIKDNPNYIKQLMKVK